MSDHPRPSEPESKIRPFPLDRLVAVVRIATVLLSSVLYFEAFHRRWSLVAPDVSILAWAPPLGSHFSSQIVGVALGAFVGAGLWCGRGWAFAYALLTCLAIMATTLLAHRSGTLVWATFALDLATFLYCGLRLFGSLGPPTGGLELRR